MQKQTYFIYFFAAASCISIAATNGALGVLAAFFLAEQYKNRNISALPKDFSIFAAVYGWKGVTMMANGVWGKLYEIKEVWDKLPYMLIGRLQINRKTLLRTMHILFIANCILITYALLEFHLGAPTIYKPLFVYSGVDFRLIGYFGSSMHYAGYISMVLIICCTLYGFGNKGFVYYIPFLLAGTILSHQRTYLLSVIVALPLIMLIRSKKAAAATLAMLLFVIAMYTASSTEFRQRMMVQKEVASVLGSSKKIGTKAPPASAVNQSSKGNTEAEVATEAETKALVVKPQSALQVRLAYWPIAFKAFKDNPIFGLGYLQFSDYLIPYFERGEVLHPAHAHNVFLEELAEGGVIGFVLILFTHVWFARKYILLAKKSKDKLFIGMAAGVAAGMANFAVAGMFEDNFGAAVLWLSMTFLMGLAEGYQKWLQAEESQQELIADKK